MTLLLTGDMNHCDQRNAELLNGAGQKAEYFVAEHHNYGGGHNAVKFSRNQTKSY